MNNGGRTILVTGATGTVGSEVVKQLKPLVQSVGTAVHLQYKADKFKGDRAVEIVNIDYNKQETIVGALYNVDKLFLVTLPTPNMTEVSSNLVKEAKKNDVGFVVKLSVMGANAKPGTIIGRLHRQEEKIIEESGIPYTFLRPTSFMQNFLNFFGQTIKNQNAFYLPTRDGKVSFVDVRDIAAVAVNVLTKNRSQHENKAYDITGRETLSFSQAAEILSKDIGKRESYIDIPEEDARKGMKTMGMENWFIDAMMEFNNIRAGHGS